MAALNKYHISKADPTSYSLLPAHTGSSNSTILRLESVSIYWDQSSDMRNTYLDSDQASGYGQHIH